MNQDSLNTAPAARLLEWYDRHARILPWRTPPKDVARGILPDPYHVWLSEVMLQQTTVAAVKNFFLKFVEKWPTVSDLAAADSEDVMKAWAGLGYYSRARNLKACAEAVVDQYSGEFPKTQPELQDLPGIGEYTSAAIAAIAFGQRAAVVDGNIERVVTRLAANATPLPAAKGDCRDWMAVHTPADRPGDFVQAMMDLGATICTPRRPACSLCPLSEDCAAFAAGIQEDFPVKAAKKPKPVRKGAAFVGIRKNDQAVLLRKRANNGLLGGMTEVPGTEWTASQDGDTSSQSAPFAAGWSMAGTVRHTFTHFHLELTVWRAVVADVSREDGWWSVPEDLPDEALPTVMKKAISIAIPDAFDPGRRRTS